MKITIITPHPILVGGIHCEPGDCVEVDQAESQKLIIQRLAQVAPEVNKKAEAKAEEEAEAKAKAEEEAKAKAEAEAKAKAEEEAKAKAEAEAKAKAGK